MKKRLLHRGQSSGRVDDNEETIKQRLATFHQQTQPVIDHYGKLNKLRKVNSENAPDVVFAEVEKIFDESEKSKYSLCCFKTS
jgi:adenylate kinase